MLGRLQNSAKDRNWDSIRELTMRSTANTGAIALYFDMGFNEIGRRPRYYPASDGREDALVMAIELLPDE